MDQFLEAWANTTRSVANLQGEAFHLEPNQITKDMFARKIKKAKKSAEVQSVQGTVFVAAKAPYVLHMWNTRLRILQIAEHITRHLAQSAHVHLEWQNEQTRHPHIDSCWPLLRHRHRTPCHPKRSQSHHSSSDPRQSQGLNKQGLEFRSSRVQQSCKAANAPYVLHTCNHKVRSRFDVTSI